MAKIAFFSERSPVPSDDISLFSAALIYALADQHHDIRVFTSDDGTDWPNKHPRVEIVRPFRRWNWWETAKLVPLLAIDAPEIVHVIQPRHESVNTFGPAAINFLSALVSFPTRPKLVLSLYELEKKALEKIRPLLMTANLVLVRSESQARELEEKWKVSTTKIQILPALSLPSSYDAEDASIPQNLASLIETGEKFIFVPGELDQHSNLDTLFSVLEKLAEADEQLKFVVQGSLSELPISERHEWQSKFKVNPAGSKTLFTGEISPNVETVLFRSAALVLLATLDPHKLKFWKHSRNALKLGIPVLLSESQARSDELEWAETGMALAADHVSEIVNTALRSLADEQLRDRAKTNSVELADRQVTDHPANKLTRLYSALLNRR